MKKFVALALVLACLLACAGLTGASAATARDTLVQELQLGTANLNPNNRCPQTPSVYCSPRYKDPGTLYGYDLRRGLSASQISSDNSGRMYGLYFKFTPRGRNQNYTVTEIDYVIQDKRGNLIFHEHDYEFVQIQPRYYFYINFLDLTGFFNNLKVLNGSITPGSYRLDIYFNGMWAGKTNFTIKK